MRRSLQHFQISAPRLLGLIFIFPLLVAFTGCGQQKSTSDTAEDATVAVAEKAASKASNDSVVAPTSTPTISSDGESCVLSGRITLDGAIPGPRKIQITKDAKTCGAAGTVRDVLGEEGGVGNVVIEIGGVKSDGPWEWNEPNEGYAIRQKDCQFTPNMIVVPIGKEISVYNDDPIGHNVNTGAWNQMQPAGPDPIVKPVEEKTPVKIVCNIHSWMEGWICPVQSPFYAVTDMKGNYQIKNIPPGKYRVTIWHPYLGRKNARMTFEPGKVMSIDHAYAVPKS